jgi:hypothetical protein
LKPIRIFKWRPVRLLLIAALLSGMFASLKPFTPGEPAVQAAGEQVYWGAYVEGAPYDTAKLDAFEAEAGKKQSIVFWGQPWAMNGAYQPFQTANFQRVRDRGQIPMLGWASWALGGGVNQPNYQLADIINGNHDAYLTQWATAARNWGHPFFLRYNHEMNGWWYPWSEKTNGNQPGESARAWRHVVDIFNSVGANNVTWVWCPNLTSTISTPLPGLYPGDSYVDWTCMDGYNWGTDRGNGWFPFNQVFGMNPWSKHDTYQDILAVAPNKPLMIGETATSKDGGDPGAWIRDALLTQLPQHYTKVKALVWFNSNDGDTTLEWPINSTPGHLAAFKESIASSYYASNTFGSLGGGPIQPLGGTTPPPPTATPVPPTETPVPPTETPVPPTATPVPPTATPVPPTETPVPPTATPVPPTETPVPPTATPVPPTATPVPPTATPVPPTATPVPPTATPVPPTATPVPPIVVPAGPLTMTLASVADTYTSAAAPTWTGAGSSLTLRSEVAATNTAYMRFNLSSLAGKTIISAKLRIKTSSAINAGSAVGHTVKYVDNNAWGEAYLTKSNNIPASSMGTSVGTIYAPATNTVYETSVTVSPVQRYVGRSMSFAISAPSADLLMFYSREGGAANAPQLILTYR